MRFIYSKKFVVFVLCLVVLVGGLWLNSVGYLEPVQYAILKVPQPVVRLVNGAVSPFRNFGRGILSVKDLMSENRRLNSEILNFRQKQVSLEEFQRENEKLKSELGFVKSTENKTIACTVLSSDPNDLADTFILDCGGDKEVSEGYIVVSEGYAVGKIVHAGRFSSTGRLITNPQSTIDAKVSRTNVEGVAKGSFGSGIILDLVSQNSDVQTGDLVVTAGIDNRTAKNILIGEISNIISGDDELFKKSTITNPVRFHDIKYVFVVVPQ